LLCDSSTLPSFRVIVDGTKSFRFKEGRKYTHPQGTFSRVQIINEDSVNPLTVNMLVGEGDITDNSVYVQSIQQIVQTVNVEDAPLLAETTLVKGAVQSIESLLQNDTALRAPLNTLDGATLAQGTTAGATTIVAAAANLNGIVVRRACLFAGSQAVGTAKLQAGAGNNILRADGAYNSKNLDAPVFIPAAVDLIANLSGAATQYDVWYEVL
jgi:hypothetical protein